MSGLAEKPQKCGKLGCDARAVPGPRTAEEGAAGRARARRRAVPQRRRADGPKELHGGGAAAAAVAAHRLPILRHRHHLLLLLPQPPQAVARRARAAERGAARTGGAPRGCESERLGGVVGAFGQVALKVLLRAEGGSEGPQEGVCQVDLAAAGHGPGGRGGRVRRAGGRGGRGRGALKLELVGGAGVGVVVQGLVVQRQGQRRRGRGQRLGRQVHGGGGGEGGLQGRVSPPEEPGAQCRVAGWPRARRKETPRRCPRAWRMSTSAASESRVSSSSLRA